MKLKSLLVYFVKNYKKYVTAQSNRTLHYFNFPLLPLVFCKIKEQTLLWKDLNSYLGAYTGYSSSNSGVFSCIHFCKADTSSSVADV